MSLAHAEDVTAWAEVIARWLRERSSSLPVVLGELQQGLEMPLVEVWLGLLLGGEVDLEQRREFYAPCTIFVRAIANIESTC